MEKKGLNKRLRNVWVCAACTALTAILFSLGEYWNFTDEIFRESAFLIADLFLLFGIPYGVYRNEKWNLWIGERIDGFIRFFHTETRLKAVWCLLVFGLLWLLGPYICRFAGIENTWIMNLTFGAIGFLMAVCWVFRKKAYEQAHRLFLIAALTVGAVYVSILPAELGYSWDDQIHFDRSVSAATLNGPYYQSDEYMYLSAWNPAGSLSEEERAERETLMDESFASGERKPYNHGDLKHISIVGYAGYAVGTVLARGFGLPYTVCFRLSKLFNVLIYSIVIAFGIRRLKYGKVLAAAAGLIPTGLYMASSYSYDPWVISFLILGYSYFFGALQRKDEKLTDGEIMVMLGAFLIGCLPKAVYVVMMLPLAFMPKEKFVSEKQYRGYLISGIAVVLMLCAVFMGPLLLFGAGSGDARGGSDVNAAEQLRFILSEPVSYIKILFRYLTGEFLTYRNAVEYSTNFAYLGTDRNLGWFIPGIVCAAGLLDKNGSYGRNKTITVMSMTAFVLTIIACASSMYITYTPVRLETINGCQARYLLPMIMPAWYINSFDRLNMNKYGNVLAVCVICIMAVLGILSLGLRVSAGY